MENSKKSPAKFASDQGTSQRGTGRRSLVRSSGSNRPQLSICLGVLERFWRGFGGFWGFWKGFGEVLRVFWWVFESFLVGFLALSLQSLALTVHLVGLKPLNPKKKAFRGQNMV